MVRLTLQSNIGEKTQNRTVAIQKCGDPPYEVALRFAGCCLRCGACFAAGYSWPEKVSSNKRVVADVPIERLVEDFDTATTGKPPFNWFRVLGGEPLLNDEYINYLFDFLVCIAKHAERFRNSVIIQTNGIHVGRGNTTVLGKRLEELYQVNPDVLVVIETSIKGTNPDEFALVARSPKSLFEYNLNSYYELLRLGIPNLRPTVIAGFGINESYLLNNGESKYRITMTRDGHTPIYHESQWSDEFRKLYEHFTNTYFALDPMFSRMPMYGLKDQFNYGWAIAALKRGRDIYAHNWYDAQYAGVRNLDIEREAVAKRIDVAQRMS